MSDIFGKLVEGAGQVISDVGKGGQIQSVLSGLRQRMAEADRRRKINTIKEQLQDLQNKEAQAINSLSAQVLALHEAGTLTQPELVSLCKRVDDIQAQIRQTEAELEQLQPPPPEPVPGQPQPEPQPQPSSANRCPNCGVAVVAGATFCQSCGSRLTKEEAPAPVRFCVYCGAELREGALFCPKCGQTVPHG
jgi:polyhydroxyalkanoate synthesis regulator phasin/predicted RNA-binding Zn-ribbon protein involved in translation (DUF1610 family)